MPERHTQQWSCCAPVNSRVTTLTLSNGSQVGLIGLPGIIRQFHREGREPAQETITAILDALKEHNYIAPSAVPLYTEAITAHYQAYCAAQTK